MSRKILAALSALVAAGCFFGGESDSPTSLTDGNPHAEQGAKIKSIRPGVYVGDYTWIDSNSHGLESEFILDTGGTYRLFWISENEAVYDQHGNWVQRDSDFYFTGTVETWVSNGAFDGFEAIEDDTNAVLNVTDTSFQRREWTPLRQKPYWITYTRKTFPMLSEGTYRFEKTYGSDSTAVDYTFNIALSNGDFLFTVIEDTVEYFQNSAKYHQIGSFLITEENQQREADSTNTLPETWTPVAGSILQRVEAVDDTSFHLWTPASFLEDGSWESFSKISAD